MRAGATLIISLLGSLLIAASLGTASASSGPGSDGLDDAIEDMDDSFDDGDDSSPDDFDNGPSNDDDDYGDNSGSNSGSSHGGDDDNSGTGRDFDDELRSHAGEFIYAVTESFDGEEVIEREYLWQAPARAVREAQREGFRVVSRTQLEALDVHLVRLRAPPNMGNARALALLRRLAPNAIVTPHHVYRTTGTVTFTFGSLSAPTPREAGGVIGIIDTGVERAHLADATALLTNIGPDGREARGREHGSLVAAIAITHGARVHVVDVFGESRDGSLVAPAASIAQAIDWMVARGVPVINISIQGPDNPVLNDIIRRAIARGHIIVAAAGNNGPYARPAFPAAFEGSVAVTAIDTEDRPYMRANRGSYIDFAAEGVAVRVQLGGRTVTATGTSFAAPVVAAQLSRRLDAPSREHADSALEALRSGVTDLGAPGHDPIYGWGAVPD
jgi:hypothetical protein